MALYMYIRSAHAQQMVPYTFMPKSARAQVSGTLHVEVEWEPQPVQPSTNEMADPSQRTCADVDRKIATHAIILVSFLCVYIHTHTFTGMNARLSVSLSVCVCACVCMHLCHHAFSLSVSETSTK